MDEAADVQVLLEQAGVDLATLDVRAAPKIPGVEQMKPGDRRFILAGVKRRAFLDAFRRDPFDLDAACAAVGWTRRSYEKNRQTDRRFAGEVDALRGGRLGRPRKEAKIATLAEGLAAAVDELHAREQEPDAPPPVDMYPDWGGFAGFRQVFFGHDTPWFHQKVVDVFERSAPGSITLILLPPEHGKTSLVEDWIGQKLATEPEFRVVYGSGKQTHGRKVGKRIKNRMHPDGPCREYVERFGPFVPQTGVDAHPQAWNQDYFDVWRRQDSDERDYNFVALGFGSEVVGTRCDLLVMDDPQSIKTLNQTDALIEEFRQDWLSRPGSKGRTVILGTRVGEGDFYEKLIDLGLIDHLIRFPAVDGQGRYLWPERYSPDEYARMEHLAGPAAWARNYQQKPSASGERTFTEDDIAKCADPLHRFGHRPTHIEGMHSAVIGWDPGFGLNAFYVGGITQERLVDLDWRVDMGLTATGQMCQILDDLCQHWVNQGVIIGHVVIEDKAFQKGLLQDEALLALQTKYGFTISGHQTGINKIDDDLGVAAMARSYRMGEIVVPGADDPDTVRARAQMDGELGIWRPMKRGSKLRQDLVMAKWFGWLRWRQIRLVEQGDRKHVTRVTSAVARPTPFRSLTLTGAR